MECGDEFCKELTGVQWNSSLKGCLGEGLCLLIKSLMVYLRALYLVAEERVFVYPFYSL